MEPSTVGRGPRAAPVAVRRWASDPRTALITFVMALLAAAATGSTVATVLVMGGLAGFSLSGSP